MIFIHLMVYDQHLLVVYGNHNWSLNKQLAHKICQSKHQKSLILFLLLATDYSFFKKIFQKNLKLKSKKLNIYLLD